MSTCLVEEKDKTKSKTKKLSTVWYKTRWDKILSSVSLGLTGFFGQLWSVSDFMFSLLFSKMAVKSMGQNHNAMQLGSLGGCHKWCKLRSTLVWLGQYWEWVICWSLLLIYLLNKLLVYGFSGSWDFRKPSLVTQPPLGLHKCWRLLWVTAMFITWALVYADHPKAIAVGLPSPDHGGILNRSPPFHLTTHAHKKQGTNH